MKWKKNKKPTNKKARVGKGKLSPLYRKIAFTILILLVYRLGSNVVLSSVDMTGMDQLAALDFFSMMSGGNLSNFALFSLGLSPFITSSIIIELLSADVVPYLTRLKKDGDKDKQNRINNALGIVLAIISAIGVTYVVDQQYGILLGGDIYSYIFTVAMMVTGSTILLWLSKQIDAYGLGRGSSMIIAAGILFRLPTSIAHSFDTIVSYSDPVTFVEFGGLMLVYLAIMLFVVFLEKSEKRIRMQFPNSTGGSYQKAIEKGNFLPIKVNPSGVVPVIFASSMMQSVVVVCTFLSYNPEWMNWFNLTSKRSILLYGVLIIAFTFFYSKVVINPDTLAKDFQKNGSSIVGVRPGEETKKYLNSKLNRLCVFGAFGLLIIALVPHVLPMVWSVAANGISIGGTSLIIVTGVTLEIANKVKEERKKAQYNEMKSGKRGMF